MEEKLSDIEKGKHDNTEEDNNQQGWFSRAWESVKSGAGSCWHGTKIAASVSKKPLTIAFLALGAASMWYLGGVAAIRNEGLMHLVPGLALLAFTLSPPVFLPFLSLRPEDEKAASVLRWFHRNFNTLTLGWALGGLSYVPLNAIAHYFDGNELSLAAKISVPIVALTTGLGTAVVKRFIQNSKNSCLNEESKVVKALKATVKKTGRVISYIIAPAGLIQLLKTARVTHTHLNGHNTYTPLLSNTNALFVFGGFGLIGFINEVGVSRLSEKLSFGVRCFFVDFGKALSITSAMTNQSLMLDAMAKPHHQVDVGDVAGAAAGWGVVTLGPSTAINISESLKERKEELRQVNPEHEPLVPKEKSKDEGLVTWQANCCNKKNKVDDETVYKLVAVNSMFTESKKEKDNNNNNSEEDIQQNGDFYLFVEENHDDTESSNNSHNN